MHGPYAPPTPVTPSLAHAAPPQLMQPAMQPGMPMPQVIQPLQLSAPKRTETVLLTTFAALVASCGLVLVLNKLRSGTRDDPDVRDLNANLRSIARELTFGVTGR